MAPIGVGVDVVVEVDGGVVVDVVEVEVEVVLVEDVDVVTTGFWIVVVASGVTSSVGSGEPEAICAVVSCAVGHPKISCSSVRLPSAGIVADAVESNSDSVGWISDPTAPVAFKTTDRVGMVTVAPAGTALETGDDAPAPGVEISMYGVDVLPAKDEDVGVAVHADDGPVHSVTVTGIDPVGLDDGPPV